MWGRTPLEGAPHQYLYHVRYIVSAHGRRRTAKRGHGGHRRTGASWGAKGGRGKAEGGAWGEGGGKRKKVGEVRSRKGLQTSFSLKKSQKAQKKAILRFLLRFSLRFCNKRWGETRRNAKGRGR